jgi:WD40 repeat protein
LDLAVKFWNIIAGQEVVTLDGHRAQVHCLAFSRDGTVLVTGGGVPGGQGEVFLCRRPIRTT